MMTEYSSSKSVLAKLNSLLETVGVVNPKRSLEMLWELLEPQPELVGFSRILAHLPDLLEILAEIRPERWSGDGGVRVLAISKLLVEHEKEIVKRFPLYSKTGEREKSPFQNYLVDNPLYTAMWFSSANSETEVAFCHLQAHYINAVDLIRQFPEDEQETAKNAVYNMSLMVRNFSQSDECVEALDILPADTLSAEQYYIVLQQFADTWPEGDAQVYLTYGARLLGRALRLRHGQRRHRLGNGFISVDAPGYLGDKLLVRQYADVGREEADDAYNQGCCRSEAMSSQVYATDDKFLAVRVGESAGSRAVKTKAKFRNIASRNQNLPFDWNRLNDHDVMAIVHVMNMLKDEAFSPKVVPIELQVDVAALFCLMFCTASSLSRAISARLVADEIDLPESIEDGSLYIVESLKVWVVCSLQQPDQGQVEQDDTVFFRKRGRFKVLPFDRDTGGEGGKGIGWPLLRNKIWNCKCGRRLFAVKQEALLAEMVMKVLAYTNKSFRTRLTLSRLCSHFFCKLSDFSEDQSDASLCFSHLPPTGQGTPLYYYAPLERHLLDVYEKTSSRIVNDVNSKVILPPLVLDGKYAPPTVSLGSELCPSGETVKCLVIDLLARIKLRQNNCLGENAFFDFHNDFTTYCVMMLGFATGYRAVRDPLSSIYDVDWQTGFVVISDKDDDHNYHSRLSWLPPLCCEQLQEYIEYRETVAQHLWPVNQQAAMGMENKAPFFFFIDENHAQQGVRPSTLREELQWSYTLPLNINRHYLRTRLREEKVPAEIVDAYMGHWVRGQEPFGRFSTLSPFAFKEALKEPLTALFREAGWKVVKG